MRCLCFLACSQAFETNPEMYVYEMNVKDVCMGCMYGMDVWDVCMGCEYEMCV